MKLKSVLQQLIEARNQNLIAHVEAWPSSHNIFSTVTIKFVSETPERIRDALVEHFKREYSCTHIQKYNIGETQFLTFVFPEVLKTVLDEAA